VGKKSQIIASESRSRRWAIRSRASRKESEVIFKFEPERVVFEGNNFIVYDVSDMIKRHKNFPHGSNDVTKPNGRIAVRSAYHKMTDRDIRILYLHQTAGSVKISGFEGLLNTAAFTIRPPAWNDAGKWTGTGRGYPGEPYTYYLAYRPDKHEGKVMIFKVWDHDWVTWHSSDNHNSIALACQGYFQSRHIRRFRARPGCPNGRPSDDQMIALDGFVHEYAIGKLGIDPDSIRGHADSPRPKPACPGDHIENFYQGVYQDTAIPIIEDSDPPMLPPLLNMLELDSWKERQAALVCMDVFIGEGGAQNNGVDGDPGDLTRMGIESMEEELGLPIDGYWDDVFDYHLKIQLLARGVHQTHLAGCM
jgi:hypothetical protein